MERDLQQQLKEGKSGALRELFDSFFPVLMTQAREGGLTAKEAESLIHQLFLDFWNAQGKTPHGKSALEFFQRKLSEHIQEAASEGKAAEESDVQELSSDEKEVVRAVIWERLAQTGKLEGASIEKLRHLLNKSVNAPLPDIKYQQMIVRYLASDLDDNEENAARHWVDQESQNSDYFEEMYEAWDQLESHPEADTPSSDASWILLKEQLAYTRVGKRARKSLGRFSLRIALGLLGIIAVLTIMGIWIGKRAGGYLFPFHRLT